MARASVCRARKPSILSSRVMRRSSPRALTAHERAHVLDILHEDRYVDRTPAAVYATLLEEGRYVCSIRTMYRLLDDAHEVRERRHQRRHPHREPPRLVATRPNQVWTLEYHAFARTPQVGDLSPLRGAGSLLPLRGGLDGRHQGDRATKAKRLIASACGKQGIQPGQLTLH